MLLLMMMMMMICFAQSRLRSFTTAEYVIEQNRPGARTKSRPSASQSKISNHSTNQVWPRLRVSHRAPVGTVRDICARMRRQFRVKLTSITAFVNSSTAHILRSSIIVIIVSILLYDRVG